MGVSGQADVGNSICRDTQLQEVIKQSGTQEFIEIILPGLINTQTPKVSNKVEHRSS